MPTLHEGSCNAIIEAMACGLPIISSNIPEIQFQCDNDSSILVDPLNVEELKASIETIFEDDNRLKEMSLAAYKYSAQFSLNKRAQDILDYLGLFLN